MLSRTDQDWEDLYRTVFWQLAAKILNDKRAPNFIATACGHAPFLTRAMRWLRQWNAKGEVTTSHDYMRKHLRGLEREPFSAQLAKLALTLADAPHGNSWAILSADMFEPGVLAKEARKAKILLANPPYESFTEAQRRRYANLGEPVTANTKAVEMLKRTLPMTCWGSETSL